MGYTVKPDGSIVTDTAEEALALQRVILRGPSRQVIARVAPEGWNRFVQIANPRQCQVLAALQAKGHLTIDDVRKLTGAKSNTTVAGILLGITKTLTKAGLTSRSSSPGIHPDLHAARKVGTWLASR